MREKKVVEIKKFDNFNSTNNEVKTKTFYNYSPSNNLKNSKGFEIATFPQNLTNKTERELNIASAGITSVDGVAYFKQYFSRTETTTHRLLIYGGDKKVYINQMMDDTFDLFWLYDLTFNSAPITLSFKKDDEDAIILASEDMMKIWKTGYSPYTISGAPVITSMCMNEGVLFCTIQDPAFKIWYATDLDAENVGNISYNSGYISLDNDLGYARKVVVFNESVYVIRDYGISKINYVKKDISISQVFSSNTKIYANTVCACGNSILFMTKDGLYVFNGIKVSKSKIEFLNNLPVENDGAISASLGEKYYLALKMDFCDNKQILCEKENCVNNVLIVIDTNDFSCEIIRGVDIKSLLPIKTEMFEKMLVVFNTVNNNKLGQVVDKSICFDLNFPKYWESENITTDLRTKLFTKLSIQSDKDVKITLVCDGEETSFLTYNSGVNEFSFKLCCKELKIKISSEEESAIVKSVVLDYYEY